VTVDLGWPWWATTLVAAVIAGAAALAYVFVRRAPLRGVLAVLVVEGVIVAALAPVVMDESSMSVSGIERLSREEFARRADDNCRRFGDFAASLGNPTTLPGIAKQFDELVPAFWKAYGDQGLLVPPRSRQERAMAWMNAMALYGRELEALHGAAKRSDQTAVNAAGARLVPLEERNQQLAAQLGMRVCFQP
jgi:hypothetical protein